jgi:hypothetical protein
MQRRLFDRALSVSAIAISLGSAAIALLAYRSSQHYAQVAVQPHVTVTPYLEGPGGRNGLYLANEGLGPARITSINLSFEGRHFEGPGESPWPIIEQAMGASGCFAHAWPEGDSVLRPGETEVFEAQTRAQGLPQCTLAVLKLLSRTDLRYTVNYAGFDGRPFVFQGQARVNDPAAIQLGNALSNAPSSTP